MPESALPNLPFWDQCVHELKVRHSRYRIRPHPGSPFIDVREMEEGRKLGEFSLKPMRWCNLHDIKLRICKEGSRAHGINDLRKRIALFRGPVEPQKLHAWVLFWSTIRASGWPFGRWICCGPRETGRLSALRQSRTGGWLQEEEPSLRMLMEISDLRDPRQDELSGRRIGGIANRQADHLRGPAQAHAHAQKVIVLGEQHRSTGSSLIPDGSIINPSKPKQADVSGAGEGLTEQGQETL